MSHLCLIARIKLPSVLVLATLAGLGGPSALAQSPYTWTGGLTAGPHNWQTDTNWSGTGVPNAIGDSASLGVNWTNAPTVQLNGAVTLGTLILNDTGGDPDVSITVSAGTGGSLTFDASTGNATLSNTGTTGSNNISAPITLVDTLDIAGSNSFGITGIISGDGAINKLNGNSLNLSGANTFSGGINLAVGILGVNNASALRRPAIEYLYGCPGPGWEQRRGLQSRCRRLQ